VTVPPVAPAAWRGATPARQFPGAVAAVQPARVASRQALAAAARSAAKRRAATRASTAAAEVEPLVMPEPALALQTVAASSAWVPSAPTSQETALPELMSSALARVVSAMAAAPRRPVVAAC